MTTLLSILAAASVGSIVVALASRSLRPANVRAKQWQRWTLIALLTHSAGACLRYVYDFHLADESGSDIKLYDRQARAIMDAGKGIYLSGSELEAVLNYPAASVTRVSLLFSFVYRAFGSHPLTAFFAFSALAAIGTLAFVAAFNLQVSPSERSSQRHATVLVLLPTIIFWATIGKDAITLFGLGLATLGWTQLTARPVRTRSPRWRSILTIGTGLTAVGLIRAHVLLVLLSAIAIAEIARRRKGSLNLVIRFLTLVAMGVGLILVARQVSDSVGSSSLLEFQTELATRELGGGSSYAVPDPFTPDGFVKSFVIVLLRPFPWEATDMAGLFASAEIIAITLGFSGITVATFVRQRRALRDPLALFYLSYVALFALAFASAGNIGTLTRQRSQLLPFMVGGIFVLLESRQPGRTPSGPTRSWKRSPHGSKRPTPARTD